MKYDYLVVGSGLYGAVFARQATDNGKNVLYMNYLTKEEIYELLNNSKFDIIYETEKHETGDNVLGEDGNDAIYIISRKRS